VLVSLPRFVRDFDQTLPMGSEARVNLRNSIFSCSSREFFGSFVSHPFHRLGKEVPVWPELLTLTPLGSLRAGRSVKNCYWHDRESL